MIKNNKSQAWIETVIYTLIMLSIIGIVLAVVKPTLQQRQDKLIIDQTINSLNSIDSIIEELMTYGSGNSREISEFVIKQGKLTINSELETIEFEIDSKYAYSQPDQNVKIGKINSFTEKKGSTYRVKLTMSYVDEAIDITFNSEQNIKVLEKASTPYKILIKNKNYDPASDLTQIDFSLS